MRNWWLGWPSRALNHRISGFGNARGSGPGTLQSRVSLQVIWGLKRRETPLKAAGVAAQEDRPNHRCYLDARHGVSHPQRPSCSASLVLQDALHSMFRLSAAVLSMRLTVADAMIRTGTANKALVIGAEVFSRLAGLQRPNDLRAVRRRRGRRGAAGFEHPRHSGQLTSMRTASTQTSFVCRVTCQAGRFWATPLLQMDGQAVFKLAVGALESAARAVLEKAGRTDDEIDWLVPHQANIRIMHGTAKKLKLPHVQGGGDGRRTWQHLCGIDSAGAGRRRAGSAVSSRATQSCSRALAGASPGVLCSWIYSCSPPI
jgi:hypothetical protein